MSERKFIRSAAYRQKMSESIQRNRARRAADQLAEQETRIDPEGVLQFPNGLAALFDPADVQLVRSRFWKCVPTKAGRWYARSFSGRGIFMHRLFLGNLPGFMADHENGNGLDNRRSNLRWATSSQNCVNTIRLTRGRSGFRGVRKHQRADTWQATINVNKRRIFTGSYGTAKEAAKAYDKAAREHFGEFAKLNFPESL